MVLMDPDADPIEFMGDSGEVGLLANRQPSLETEPDESLITFMALQDEDLDLAQRACEELYRRHARLLVGWCMKNRRETYGRDATELVNLTFERAFRAAHRYRAPTGLDERSRTHHVVAWLFQILGNAYLDSRRAESREPFRRDDTEDGDHLLVNACEPVAFPDAGRVPPVRRNLVLRYLDSLEGLDRAILVATAECWSPTASRTELPPHVRRALCVEFGITENTLRVRRHRALERLRLFILNEESRPSQPHEHPPKR